MCLPCSSVDSADTAGDEDLDACHGGCHHGSCYSGGSVHLLGHDHGEISSGYLEHALGCSQIFDLFRSKAHFDHTVDDGDGCRDCSVLSDDLFNCQRCLHVLRIRHSVSDDGGFESHYSLALFQSFLYFGFYIQILHF